MAGEAVRPLSPLCSVGLDAQLRIKEVIPVKGAAQDWANGHCSVPISYHSVREAGRSGDLCALQTRHMSSGSKEAGPSRHLWYPRAGFCMGIAMGIVAFLLHLLPTYHMTTLSSCPLSSPRGALGRPFPR
jgi:hypothetical protein